MSNTHPEEARQETLEELSQMLLITQDMGRRLANESHGHAFDEAQILNNLLHQARLQLDRIKKG